MYTREVETPPGSWTSEPDKDWIRICFLNTDKNDVPGCLLKTVKIGVTSVLKLVSAA